MRTRAAATLLVYPLSLALTHIRHRGKGAAVRAGMQKVSAPVIGYCDADLSAGPDAIPQVYDRVRQGSDMAMGSRGLPDSVLETDNEWWPLEPVKSSVIDLAEYERGGDIARRVTSDQRGRIVTLVPGPRRFRPVLSGAEEAQGYNPAQLVRYWTFIRFVYREPLIYSHSTFRVAPKAVQDLLAVGWLAKSGEERGPGLLAPVAEEPPVFLFLLRDPSPFLQGVPIPPGDHVVELTHRDPSIGWGVAGSLVSIGVLLAAALAVALATRRSVG